MLMWIKNRIFSKEKACMRYLNISIYFAGIPAVNHIATFRTSQYCDFRELTVDGIHLVSVSLIWTPEWFASLLSTPH
jgi:hypothetical protein